MNQLVQSNQRSLVTQEEIQVMKDSLFRNFTDPEIKYCVVVINQLNLSPLLRQIHFVKRFDNKLKRDVITPQTGIDGLRLVAERTGQYAGSDEPVFEYSDQVKKNPIKATVTVYKLLGGHRCPFTSSARWDEFHPGGEQGFMWNKMPHNQLAKCAEAAALRKAFPAELSSLYSDDEMHQADSPNDKAQKLQEKITEEVKGEIIRTPEILPAEKNYQAGVPVCCGREMMISRYDSGMYYCKGCQKKVPKA